ncbi:unnamed protein product [Adineta steineri]|uniref:Uncharacterized protein n=2 Tax=Adineta steineri TaxID=433720 RepID=A0A814WTC4_9BILA|nr:unnamed protein product [Adineta steineri]CAF3590096.1 unnamed protein product [Adineta steineri]
MEKTTTNVQQETVSVINENDEIARESSILPPSYTVGDLQQNLGSNTVGIIGGTNPDEDEKIIQNILRMIKGHERRQLWWNLFSFLFILLLLPPVIFLIFMPICMYKKRMSGMNQIVKSGIRYMIRLEGDQWIRYVQHINNEPKRKMNKSSRKELLSRSYGHILIGTDGFFLDSMLGMQYENIMIVRTEIIQAPNKIDMMLRAWFCQRLVVIRTQNGQTNGAVNNDPFKFDIFLPLNMSTELVSSITNFMKLESVCRPNFIL